MPRGIKKTETEKQWEAIEKLENTGMIVPEILKSTIRNQLREEQGIKQVYKCKTCKEEIVLHIFAKSVECCGRIHKPLWESSTKT